MLRPTNKQKEICEAIDDYWIKNEVGPSFADLGEVFSITPQAIRCHIQAMEDKGLVERKPGTHRTLRTIS